METSTGIVGHNTVAQRPEKGRGGRRLLFELKLVFTLLILGIIFSIIFSAGYAFAVSNPQLDITAVSSAFLGILISPEFLLYAGIGAFFAPLLLLVIWRTNAARNAVFKTFNGCPNCRENDLLRVQRQPWERVAAKITLLKLNRCACRNCDWQGLLIGSKHGVPSDWLPRSTYEPDDEVWLNVKPEKVSGEDKIFFKEVPQHNGNGTYQEIFDETHVEIFKRPVEPVPDKQDSSGNGSSRTIPTAKKTDGQQVADDLPVSANQNSGQVPDLFDLKAFELEPGVNDLKSDLMIGDPTTVEEPIDDKGGLAPMVVADSLPTSALDEMKNAVITSEIEQNQCIDVFELEPEPDFIASLQTRIEKFDGPVVSTPVSFIETEDSTFVQPSLNAEAASSQVEENIVARALVVSPFGLKLRDEPRTDGKILMVLKTNDVVDFLPDQDIDGPATWRHVQVGRQVGWVSAAFLKRLNGGNLTGNLKN